MTEEIDLGYNHKLSFTQWNPDRKLNPQYAGIPDIPKIGAIVTHLQPKNKTGICASGIFFDLERVKELVGGEKACWQVESWEPLSISPSLLCKAICDDGSECGDHGLIKNGKWVPA